MGQLRVPRLTSPHKSPWRQDNRFSSPSTVSLPTSSASSSQSSSSSPFPPPLFVTPSLASSHTWTLACASPLSSAFFFLRSSCRRGDRARRACSRSRPHRTISASAAANAEPCVWLRIPLASRMSTASVAESS
ncbi:hypothetical protein K505DRAFT_53880 [Melanomma pulvis-pyrius CBS 109.77]|uniref:Uncharacterized protein n=1 Tax=Melanomma pulvis-pyrius CBS 109.77 TaxID=1314802 RepID=A0A6A6X7N1_9PLEO|nr:hypothetical protein K505DRAFT_53880 [Melanomma pulvis-pyrius CBS 109.77]